MLVAFLLAGCTNAGSERVVSVNQTGTVQGRVSFDVNGSGAFEQGTDMGLAQIGVRLIARGTRDTTVRGSSDAAGAYTLTDVPIGDYALSVDTSTFGDSIQVEKIDSAGFTVPPGGTVTVNVQVSYPRVSIGAARALPLGRRVFVVGVALNGSATFSDSIAGFVDTSGAVMLTRNRSTFVVGDSLRVIATTAQRAGQPTLDDATVFALGQGRAPTAPTLTTAAAATAAGGTRDAQLVVLKNATISSTATEVLRDGVSYFSLTVSDGSGNLQVLLDPKAGFVSPVIPGVYVRGNKFNIVGLLVPTGLGSWMLKPRSTADLALLPSVISIDSARALPAGQTVTVVGVALNGSTTFSDATVHLTDTSGAIRLTRLQASMAFGDSVRVAAVTASQAGQPTLDSVTSTLISTGHAGYLPTILATAAAATAASGTRDAQLVSVLGAVISDTVRTSTSFLLTVSDGSGPLVVQLDQTAGFVPPVIPSIYVAGNTFNIVGLLVPTGSGSWMLKPRSPADLTLPVISIAAARALPTGRTVAVVGVALNSSATFSDTTVHLIDASGAAIRLTRLRATLAAGDSVKITAAIASRAGQPTLDQGTSTALGTGLPPTAPTLTTAVAATAAEGTRDAQPVVVNNATISSTATVPNGFSLTVSDGSGNLTVLLDQKGGFTVPGIYIAGNKFNIVGLLVPTGTAGTWMLKPRSSTDLVGPL